MGKKNKRTFALDFLPHFSFISVLTFHRNAYIFYINYIVQFVGDSKAVATFYFC